MDPSPRTRLTIVPDRADASDEGLIERVDVIGDVAYVRVLLAAGDRVWVELEAFQLDWNELAVGDIVWIAVRD